MSATTEFLFALLTLLVPFFGVFLGGLIHIAVVAACGKQDGPAID